MQPQNKKEKKLTQKQLKNREKNQAKQNKKMNKQMNIQLRNQLLFDEVKNQPGAEGTALKHFNGIMPSKIPSDYSNLEGYGVIENKYEKYKG